MIVFGKNISRRDRTDLSIDQRQRIVRDHILAQHCPAVGERVDLVRFQRDYDIRETAEIQDLSVRQAFLDHNVKYRTHLDAEPLPGQVI